MSLLSNFKLLSIALHEKYARLKRGTAPVVVGGFNPETGRIDPNIAAQPASIDDGFFGGNSPTVPGPPPKQHGLPFKLQK